MPDNGGINRVFLLGEVLTEPRRHTGRSSDEYHFTLVTKEKFEKRNEPIEHLEYHHIRVAAMAVNNRRPLKGQMLHVEGKIHTLQHTDDMNIKRYTTEVVAHSISVVEINQAVNANGW